MAVIRTPAWVNTAPCVQLTVTQSASTETSSTLSWTLQYIAESAASTSVAKSYSVKIAGSTVKSGTYNINGKVGTYTIASGTKTINKTTATQTITFSVSFAFNLTWSGVYKGTLSASGSISVPPKTSYSIKYNANGGSGAPSTQTKWHGSSVTLSSTKPTRTGYIFQGWATSSGGSVTYSAGGSYSSNASVTLYAVWKAITYLVQYNANGGTGAPSSQTKTYGKTLTLSTTKPVRSKYNFLGWGTSASAKTVTYSAGGSYTSNAASTLYAVWSVAYTKPRITDFTVERCEFTGFLSDEGKYAQVTFNWATDTTVSSIVIARKSSTDTTWTSTNLTASGTSGTVSTIIGSGALATNTAYTIRVTVTDSLGSNTASMILPSKFYTMDYNEGGTAAALGGEADVDGAFKNNFDLMQVGNRYSYQPIAFNGERGYTLLATVQVTSLNANTPITFVISKRGTMCPMTVHARFASSSSTLDPDLGSFVYEGDNFGAFFCKTAASTWNLYVDNLDGWSNPCVQDWYTSRSNAARIKVTFPSEQVTELPQPWYRAIPAQVRSILDFIYPVGSIYICYSHADPASMFGGTWVRIENAFLWGVDSSGSIGLTGGEKTHALTVNELPAHSHGSVYSQNASGTKNLPWYSGSGDKLAYGTVSTGGGAAHNNMPPYIQVSIWRRTA